MGAAAGGGGGVAAGKGSDLNAGSACFTSGGGGKTEAVSRATGGWKRGSSTFATETGAGVCDRCHTASPSTIESTVAVTNIGRHHIRYHGAGASSIAASSCARAAGSLSASRSGSSRASASNNS